MVTLEQIRKDMNALLKMDRNIQSVEVRADTLDEALADAAVQFDTSVRNLEYEVVEKGFKGIAGLAKKPWAIRVYQNPETVVKKAGGAFGSVEGENEEDEEEKIVPIDGAYYVHRFGSDIVLKVVLPENGGNPVNENEIINDLKRPDTVKFDEARVRKLAKSGTNGKYETIGSYNHVPSNDAIFVIDVAQNEMNATATINPPGMGGADVSADQIRKAIETQGVLAGISDEKISALVDSPVYNAPVVVAEAQLPINGKDAYIVYEFETDRSKLKVKESDSSGKINFKESNLVQNRLEGQVLARKIPAEKGKAGKTLFAKYLEASDGRDIPLPLGKNVKVGEDGLTILAAMNGQVMLVNDKVSIEPIMEVAGVNLKTGGNIKFLGTVIVKGNVEDGFSVEASGNIEVFGNVGSCNLSCEGDIVVSQGIIGRDSGRIDCKGSLWARFVESAEIHAEENVVVQESIMNSNVSAQKKIILTGKKAQIVGGKLFATEIISAKNIGAGGAETELTVGVDPRAKHRLEELQALSSEDMHRLDEIELEIKSLEEQQKRRRSLPKDKEESLQSFYRERDRLLAETDTYNGEISEIQERLKELRNIGKVYVSGTAFAGVKIYIRDDKEEVRSDVKAAVYYYDLENRFIKRGKYEAPDLTDVRGPDGYSSN